MFFVSITLAAQIDWQANTTNVQSFSSTRCTDLNGDGILDAVIGAGLEEQLSNRGIIAVNGADGSFLWFAEARDQIFGSPLFLDINADGTDDVFIGGRGGEFRALDGTTGSLIWEFYSSTNDSISPADEGVYQFYTPQLIPDHDGDGLQDLLQANGGDPSALLPTDPRPAGKIQVISSANGALLASVEVPDGQETYMSPLVADFYGDGDLEVIFGTGGESQFGSLWRVDFTDLLNNDLSSATPILSSGSKGLIAPPSLADLNDDSVLDIIVNTYDGRIVAISGINNTILWQIEVEMGETNASPAIGYFNSDNIPDVFVAYAIGLAPTFTNFRQFMIDGSTGIIQWQDSLGLVQFGSPLALDTDGDFFDEVIYGINEMENGTFKHQILSIDFNDNTTTEISSGGGTSPNGTPWIGDMDGDDQLDLVYTFQRDSTSFINEEGVSIRKVSLETATDAQISWGAYLGNDYTATFENIRSNCADLDNIVLDIIPTSNGDTCVTEVSVSSSACPNIEDCEYLWSNGATTASTTLATMERQTVSVTHPGGCTKSAKIDFESVSLTSVEIDSMLCIGDPAGSIFIDFEGGFPPYTTSWNGVTSGGTTNTSLFIQSNLEPGTYTFEVTDAIGCISNNTFTLPQPDSLILNAEPREPTTLGNDGEISYSVTGNEPITVTLNGETITDTTNTFSNLPFGSYDLVAIDANGCMTDTSFVFLDPTGLHNLAEAINFRILSQPSQVTFIFEDLKLEGNILRIYNIQGLLTYEIDIPTNGSNVTIQTGDLPMGMYVAELQTSNTRKMKKFLLH